jgi:hypothetical protein
MSSSPTADEVRPHRKQPDHTPCENYIVGPSSTILHFDGAFRNRATFDEAANCGKIAPGRGRFGEFRFHPYRSHIANTGSDNCTRRTRRRDAPNRPDLVKISELRHVLNHVGGHPAIVRQFI